MNNDILTSNTDNCTDSVPVDAVQLPSTEPTAKQLEQQMLAIKSRLWRQCYISNERAWLRYVRSEYRTHKGLGGRCSTGHKEKALWAEYFVTALQCGHDVKADIAELDAREKAERDEERQLRKREEEEQQRWRDENPEAYAEQLKEQELRRHQLEGSTAQPQKQKRGKRGKDRQQRTTNPKAWINDIAQLGFKGVQLQIALHIIGLCRKQHDQGKGGCGINRKRVQERYKRSLRTVEVVIQRLRDAGVITVERAKPQLKQKYGEQYGQFGKTSLTEAFRNGTCQPQPQADSTAASEPKTAAKAAVRIIFCEKTSDPSDQQQDNQSQGRSTAENTPKAAAPLDLSSPLTGSKKKDL